MALIQYSQDYDEHWIAEERYYSGNRYQWPAILVNYTKSKDVFRCPSNSNPGVANDNGQDTFVTAYGANINGYQCYSASPWDVTVTTDGNGMFGGTGSAGVSEAEVQTPSTTIALAEMCGGQWNDMLELDDNCADWSKWRFAVPHVDRRSNYLFADGHIKAMRPFDTIANGVNMWTRDNTLPVWQGLRDHLQTGYDNATQK